MPQSRARVQPHAGPLIGPPDPACGCDTACPARAGHAMLQKMWGTGRANVKIIIGNRNYSSWSLRGWLAARQSGLPFETELRVMDSPDWVSGAAKADLPSGMVPVLWDHGVPIWDSLAIVLYLADRSATIVSGRGRRRHGRSPMRWWRKCMPVLPRCAANARWICNIMCRVSSHRRP